MHSCAAQNSLARRPVATAAAPPPPELQPGLEREGTPSCRVGAGPTPKREDPEVSPRAVAV
eukprot:13508958-Alexandrium_andersonii.AAC.1